MIKLISILTSSLFFFYSCNSQEKRDFDLNDIIEITHPYTKVDTSGKKIVNNIVVYPYRQQYFIIQNFGGYNDSLIKFFSESRINESDTIYTVRDLYFFKSSKFTNLEHLKKVPRDIDRHSNQHDILYHFRKTTRQGEATTLTRY